MTQAHPWSPAPKQGTPSGKSPSHKRRWTCSWRSTPGIQATPGSSPPPGPGPCTTTQTPWPRCTSASSRTPDRSISGSTISGIPSPPCPSKRRGHQNLFRHAGALRRWVHPADLHPHHEAKAGRDGAGHGKPHGAGTILPHRLNTTAHRLGSQTSLPVRCVFCAVWVTVWVLLFSTPKAQTLHRGKEYRGAPEESPGKLKPRGNLPFF